MNKVAKITVIFWLMKIIATTLGETMGDFFSMTLNMGYGLSLVMTALVFLIFLTFQLLGKRYVPVIYWFVIISTTTLGTEISDFIDRSLHLGYTSGSLLLLSCLLITLMTWNRKFKTLEVFPISDPNKEIFYWMAILFSNSLGTAFGDYLADVIGLSYLEGAFITSVIILFVVALHEWTKINHILLFWLAFIFTRPFGATFGDFLTKTPEQGGLNFGTLTSSLVCLVLMTLLIIYSHRRLARQSAT